MHQVQTTSSFGSSEEALHVRFHASDCAYNNAYRHYNSYPPSSSTKRPFGQNKGTAAIPIDRSSMRKTASEHQMALDEAEADYKDFVFFSRVVDGISRQNSLLQDGSYLKSTNNTLIDNIVRSRHTAEQQEEKGYEEEEHTNNRAYYYTPAGPQQAHNLKIVTPTKSYNRLIDTALYVTAVERQRPEDDFEHEDLEQDEGIFDFEL